MKRKKGSFIYIYILSTQLEVTSQLYMMENTLRKTLEEIQRDFPNCVKERRKEDTESEFRCSICKSTAQ